MDTAAGPFLGMHQTAPDVEYPRENAPLESLAPNNARLSPVCSLQQRFLNAGMEPPPRPRWRRRSGWEWMLCLDPVPPSLRTENSRNPPIQEHRAIVPTHPLYTVLTSVCSILGWNLFRVRR